MKLDFKKMSQLQGGEGGVETFSNFLKIRCPNMGGGEGGVNSLGTSSQVLQFFFLEVIPKLSLDFGFQGHWRFLTRICRLDPALNMGNGP